MSGACHSVFQSIESVTVWRLLEDVHVLQSIIYCLLQSHGNVLKLGSLKGICDADKSVLDPENYGRLMYRKLECPTSKSASQSEDFYKLQCV